MQFVRSGPDIPERLLQAHEDGRVVFFCGAGISNPAGLPEFAGLVDQLFENFVIAPDPVEASAIKSGQYDIAVGLLETKVQGGRQAVREELARILTPDLDRRGAMATHGSLLTLGKNREGRTRLITTNFDRLFEETIARTGLQVERFRAPLLPVPKMRWDGLVYLHGLLTNNPSEQDLERLVVSSGDFGLAYLAERWAARFVSDLFRNFAVCFVGYRINDPVLRYMMDALAADRLLGESPPEMFAFGSFSKGKREDAEREWLAKSVTPILYQKHWHHAYLHRTLKTWAETCRDGVRGKEHIIVTHAGAQPQANTRQDNFADRVLWALSDPSGLPAKRFAELDPVPPIEWLEPLSEERLQHSDLTRFGIIPDRVVDERLEFSLVHRPSPYTLAPWMALVGVGAETVRWDNVMEQIARWLTRHLDDPDVLLWLARRGGALHDRLALLIKLKLAEISRLEQENDQGALDEIRANAPNAIPRGQMRTLWQLLLKECVQTGQDDLDLFRWCEQLRSDGLTVPLRLDLRKKLAPRVVLRKPLDWPVEEEDEEATGPEHMSRLVDADIVLSSGSDGSQLQDLANDDRWIEALPDLQSEFAGLLKDALDLMSALEKADDRSDPSWIHLPSISEHEQNNSYQDWTILIELVRDSWLAMCDRSAERARAAAEAWLAIRYPVFRRLVFFAAAQDGIVPIRTALDWLLSDDRRWLWSQVTQREAMRLLARLASGLNETEQELIETAILAGPPRAMYKDDIEPEEWDWIQQRNVWLRLSRLAASGASLSDAGAERMDEISAHYPNWKLAEDEQDEFPIWSNEWSGPKEIVATPREFLELVEWLKASPDSDPWSGSNWPDRCRRDFDMASAALIEVATQGTWPTQHWREALHAWEDGDLMERSWDKVAPVLAGAPDAALQEISRGASHWLSTLARNFKGQETTFLSLCDRLLELDYEEEDEGDEDWDPLDLAINHPVGQATEALLNWFLRGSLEDGQGLCEDLKPVFSKVCEGGEWRFRHGRVLLAAHVIALFRVDPDWTKQFLLPLFEWKEPEVESQTAWKGFLWSPRLHAPLMEALKTEFLDTANHYEQLGRHGVQYSSFLTFAALDSGGVFSRSELAQATVALPSAGLDNAAKALARAIEAAGDRRPEYWSNRVEPYLRHVWPKTGDVATESVAESFARVCIAAGDAFPAALERTRIWLQGLEFPVLVIRRLQEENLQERFPTDSLQLLDAIVGEDAHVQPDALGDCLRTIRERQPELESDLCFMRLTELIGGLE